MRLDTLLAAVPAPAPAARLPLGVEPSSTDDLAYLTIWHASQLIRRREISPVDLVQACLARIERFEPGIKAWLAVYAEDALAAARTATEEITRDGPRTPLHGIPVGHKDLYDIAGKVTTASSKVRADALPATQDATAVALLRAAGAITLGKLNTHEFAYGV